jgi:signal transduction histidine kinase
MDAEGHVVMANRAAKNQFFGTFGDQPDSDAPLTVELRRPSGERLLPEDVASEHGATEEAHESATMLLRCSDGTIVPVLLNATPIHMEGQTTGTVLVLERATEVADETATRAEWATAMAHDLRQPINSIMLTSDLLLQGNMAEDQRQHLLRVRSWPKRLSRMVGDMAKLAEQAPHH